MPPDRETLITTAPTRRALLRPAIKSHVIARLAIALVVLQVLQFWVVDRPFSHYNQALYHYPSDDIIEIALREDPNPRSRYSQLVALAQIAPHSTYLVPTPDVSEEIHRLYGFARAQSVTVIPRASHELPLDFPVEDYLAAAGPGAHRGAPWLILLDPARPGGDPDQPWDYLTDALEGGQRGTDPGPAREFVMLIWKADPWDEPSFADYGYYSVAVETSLLDVHWWEGTPADSRAAASRQQVTP